MADERPAWDDVWMDIAKIMAGRSRCVKAKVGAVVVTADNRVASTGYNGPSRGLLTLYGTCENWCPRMQSGDTSAEYGACATIHSEANALVRADYSQIQGGTIYVSRASCINCAKLIANSGLSHVVHRVTENDLHRDPDGVELYLEQCGLKVTRVD